MLDDQCLYCMMVQRNAEIVMIVKVMIVDLTVVAGLVNSANCRKHLLLPIILCQYKDWRTLFVRKLCLDMGTISSNTKTWISWHCRDTKNVLSPCHNLSPKVFLIVRFKTSSKKLSYRTIKNLHMARSADKSSCFLDILLKIVTFLAALCEFCFIATRDEPWTNSS